MLCGAKFRPLSQKNGRGRCTTPTHIYKICIGFKLIRPKLQDKFRIEHWKKSLGLVKCYVDLSSDTSHRQTDGSTSPPKERSTTSTHMYSICIGFRLIRPKPLQEFRTKHWKKSLGFVKCCGDLSSDASHRQTDESTSPPRGGAKLQPIYF